MRKVIWIGLICGLVLAFCPFAMAGQGGQHGFPQYTCAPTGLDVYFNGAGDDAAPPGPAPLAEVCFDWLWECGGTPVKYAIDVEMLVDGTGWDDPEAVIEKVSFGTGDRTDGEALNATFLCVPIEAFFYMDGLVPVQFGGDARFKVKALGKGKSENNTFSNWFEFEVPVITDIAPDGAP
jgi:hypothetical protein